MSGACDGADSGRRAALAALYADVERLAPGDDATRDWALALALSNRKADVPGRLRVLDAGCGRGADIAALLASAPRVDLCALDIHSEFLAAVDADWADVATVDICHGYMLDPGGPFDLIWSAGAVYAIGVDRALNAWRRALVPGGRIAFSHLIWLKSAPPEAARRFWRDALPAMGDEADLRARIAAAGYRLLGHRVLPASAWKAYYAPLEARLTSWRSIAMNPAQIAVAEGMAAEIAVWKAAGGSYGYVQMVVEPA